MEQQWGQQPPPGVPVLASWGRRLAALLIDDALILIPAALFLTLAIVASTDEEETEVLSAIGLILFFFCIFVLPGIYFTVMHGRAKGQTWGKQLLGIRVIDEVAGGPIGYGRAFGRWAIQFAMGFVCGFLNLVDGLWPLWDERNQSWHDKLVHSVVVRVPAA